MFSAEQITDRFSSTITSTYQEYWSSKNVSQWSSQFGDSNAFSIIMNIPKEIYTNSTRNAYHKIYFEH